MSVHAAAERVGSLSAILADLSEGMTAQADVERYLRRVGKHLDRVVRAAEQATLSPKILSEIS